MNVRKLAQVRALVSSTRHGNPGRDLNIILIVGEYGKSTVASLFEAIAKEAGKSMVRIPGVSHGNFHASLDDFFQVLATVKKDKPDYVVIEATDSLLSLGALSQLDIGTLVLTSDHPRAEQLLRESPRHVVAPSALSVPEELIEPYKHISFGDDDAAEAKLEAMRLYKKGTEIDLSIDHQIKLTLASYLVGQANAWNLLIAASMAYVLGFNMDTVQEAIADIEPVSGNFTLEDTALYSVFYDKGTHEASIERAVSSARQLTKRRLVVAVCTPSVSDKALETVRASADRVFVVATADRELPHDVDKATLSDDAIEKARRAAKSGDVVLVIGVAAPEKDNDK